MSVLNKVNCSAENAVRKIDATGRVIIPKGLRDRIGLKEGDEMTFYFLEADGFSCIGIGKNNMVDPKYAQAKNVLEELGVEIPKELLDKIN